MRKNGSEQHPDASLHSNSPHDLLLGFSSIRVLDANAEDTPLGFRVHCTEARWDLIATTKHPPMRGRIDQVKATLEDHDEIRRSLRDPEVLLFHRRADQRWYCAVARRTGSTGFLITAYPADKVKRGELLWTK